MFTKITIHTLSTDNWPVDFEIEPEKGNLATAIAFLESHGFTPAPTAQDAKTIQMTHDGLPICPKHGAVMKLRQKQGDEWHSHRVAGPNGEELWCKGYADKSSPGWNH